MTFEEACGIKPKEPESDPVHHPLHYEKHAIKLEPIDLLEHLPFCLGNCLKYVIRAKDKGNELQDLYKALFYLERARERDELGEFEKIAIPCRHSDVSSINNLADNVLVEKRSCSEAFDYLQEDLADQISFLENGR